MLWLEFTRDSTTAFFSSCSMLETWPLKPRHQICNSRGCPTIAPGPLTQNPYGNKGSPFPVHSEITSEYLAQKTEFGAANWALMCFVLIQPYDFSQRTVTLMKQPLEAWGRNRLSHSLLALASGRKVLEVLGFSQIHRVIVIEISMLDATRPTVCCRLQLSLRSWIAMSMSHSHPTQQVISIKCLERCS